MMHIPNILRPRFHGNTLRLSYGITKYYPWRWFTPFITVFSLVALVILTLINVAANGYETVDILFYKYNPTQSLWWSAFSGPQSTICDPHQLTTGDTFYTTSGAFQYSVGAIQSEAYTYYEMHDGIASGALDTGRPMVDSWLYSGASLATLCEVGYFIVGPSSRPSLNLTVDRLQSNVNAEILHTCTSSSDASTTMQFKMSYQTSLLDSPSYLASTSTWSDDYTLLLTTVLDWLAMDMLVSVVNATYITSLHVGAIAYCPTDLPGVQEGQLESAQCTNELNYGPPIPSLTSGRILYDNGSIGNIVDSLTPALNQSIFNFLGAFLAASLADMGVLPSRTFFLNPDIVNTTISSPDAISAAVGANPDLKTYYNQPDSDWFIIPAAETIRTQSFSGLDGPFPYIMNSLPSVHNYSCTIATTYVCHIQRLKSPFSLIVSIIVADASEFAALWGVVMLIATYFAQRRDQSNLNYNVVEHDQPQDEEANPSSRINALSAHMIEEIHLNVIHDDHSFDPHIVTNKG